MPSENKFEKYVEFRGEQVRIPSNFPVHLFEQAPEELEEYLNKTLGASGARMSDTQFTYEQLGAIIAKHSPKYPSINSNMEHGMHCQFATF